MKPTSMFTALFLAVSLGATCGASAKTDQGLAAGLTSGPFCIGQRCPYPGGPGTPKLHDPSNPAPAVRDVQLAQGGLPLCVANRCPKKVDKEVVKDKNKGKPVKRSA